MFFQQSIHHRICCVYAQVLPFRGGFRRGFRSTLHHAHDALNDIIHIGEVAATIAIVENLDGVTLQQLIGKAKVGHVRAAGRAIDREEAQTCGGDIVEFGIAMGKELVALLGSGIEADRIIHAVVGAEGHLLVSAIDTAGTGIDQVLHREVATGLQDIVEAHHVAHDIGIGILDRIAHTCLRGKVDHNLGLIFGEELIDEGLIGDIGLEEAIGDTRRGNRRGQRAGRGGGNRHSRREQRAGIRGGLGQALQFFEAVFLEGNLVVGVEIIDIDNRGASCFGL